MRRHTPPVVLALLLLASPSFGTTIVLDFEEEPATYYDGVPFTSIECGCVEFSEVSGGYVSVEEHLAGNHVLVPGEEGGRLLMTFLAPVTAIALDFGNDRPDSEFLGPATLEGLVGGQVVVSTTVAPNVNHLIDQTITLAYDGVLEQARFYMQQSGEFEPVSPLLDNLVLTVLSVPEPSTVGLLLLALVVGRVVHVVLPVPHER